MVLARSQWESIIPGSRYDNLIFVSSLPRCCTCRMFHMLRGPCWGTRTPKQALGSQGTQGKVSCIVECKMPKIFENPTSLKLTSREKHHLGRLDLWHATGIRNACSRRCFCVLPPKKKTERLDCNYPVAFGWGHCHPGSSRRWRHGIGVVNWLRTSFL